MNRLSVEKRCSIVQALVECGGVRPTARMTGVSKWAVLRLIENLGWVAADFQDRTLRDLPCRRIECDELRTICYAHPRNVPPEYEGRLGYGEVWTWVAMDSESKLVATWLIGDRSRESASEFMADLAPRLRHRVQITTDGLGSYVDAIRGAFGDDVDYAMTVKDFREGKPVENTVISGDPDPSLISTSLIERQNLTLRMGLRRYARRTNAHSKKLGNHAAQTAIWYLYYNFVRPHMSLHDATPAQAIGLSPRRWTIRDMIALLEAEEAKRDALDDLVGAGLMDRA